MKIIATSDLHGNLPKPESIPPCDIFIVAGDICPISSHDESYQAAWIRRSFVPFMSQVNAKHKIWTPGNHDFVCDGPRQHFDSPVYTCLIDQAVTVEGIKIYGTPWTPTFGSWAFMEPEASLAERFAYIPEDTDILVSHGPPRGICDRTIDGGAAGSIALLEAIRRTKPSVLITGHIHEAYGLGHYSAPPMRMVTTHVYNVSHVDFNYKAVNRPVEILLS